VLLVFAAPGQLLSLAGLEHGRTIPLAEMQDETKGARRHPETRTGPILPRLRDHQQLLADEKDQLSLSL
jgi:hypothetical protein